MVKILAIDDINYNLISLKAIINDAFPDAIVYTSLNGLNGIELAIANDPDVILLDIIMPGMDGFEVCQRLKQDQRVLDIPVVFLTAIRDDKESRIKALEVGAEAFLSKPIDETELTAQIRAMVKIKAANEQKRDEKKRLEMLVKERTKALQKELMERKRVEEALRESEERFQMLFNKAPLGYQSLDSDGHFIEVNQQWLETLGYTRKEVIGKWFGDFLSPEYQDGFRQRFPVFKSLGKIHSEFEMVHKNGTKLFIAFEGKIGYTLDGEFKQTHCILQDITESRKLGEELKKSFAFTEATLESIHNGILVISHQGIVLKTSKRFVEMWNISDEILASGDDNTMINSVLEQLVDPDGFLAVVGDVYKKPEAETLDLIYFKDGRVFERISKPMYLGGEPKGRIWSFLDITERMNTVEQLRSSKEAYRRLIDNVDEIIYSVSLDGNAIGGMVNFVSGQATQILGYSPEEFIRNSELWFTLIHPDDTERIARQTNSCFENKKFETRIYRMKHKHTGEYLWLEDRPQFLFDEYGTIIGQYGTARDITKRKQAEEELQKSYDLLNKLAVQVPGVVYKYLLRSDGSSAFPYSSPGMKDIYEVSPEEVREDASPVFTRIHPEDFDAIVESIAESARNNTLYNSEFRVVLPRQGLRWRACDAKPERLEDGSTLWHGIITDITDRKQAELALKESEDRYKSFISQVTEGVYRFECDEPLDLSLPLEEQVDFIYDHFYIAECNDAMLKMYKISDRNEIVGKSHLDFHGGRDNPVNRELLRDFIRNGYSIENGITEEFDVNGQLKYISNNSIGITEHGYLIRTWGTETDITEKIRTDHVQQVLYAISNAALSSIDLTELIGFISAQLGKLLDSTNFYIAFYDEDTGMLSTQYEKDEKDSINSWPAEKSMTGYVIRNQKSLLASEADVKRLHEAGETELVGTASKIWLGVPLSVSNKVIGAIVVQSYDNPNAYTEKDQLMLEFVSHQVSISIERKMAEEELKHALIRAQESDRLKSAFLANMSHEIRTPLNSIIGFSELLLDPEFDPDQHAEFAGMISASGNSLLAIITDLMDISKIEAGQVQLQKSTFSVHKLIADIQKEYSFQAGEKGIELRLDSSNPRNELFIQNDENRIKQILINFVGNAIKFTERGFVEIGLIISDQTFQIQVKDSGIGIPKEFHHKIFERFTQVEASNKRKYGGNGLGLAISKSLAELLGGEIGLQSEQGKGSLFYITLPL